MMVRLLEPAQAELDEAIAWYADQAPGLGDEVLVLAIAHQHRKPNYWRSRLM